MPLATYECARANLCEPVRERGELGNENEIRVRARIPRHNFIEEDADARAGDYKRKTVTLAISLLTASI